MQPSDFDKIVPKRSTRCISAGPGWGDAGPDFDSPYTFDVDGIYYVSTDKVETKLVNFYAWMYDVYACNLIGDKWRVSKEIHDGARAYWHRRFHREYYQRVIAQWIQRELELPGEIATAISSFA